MYFQYQNDGGVCPGIKWCSGTNGKNLPLPSASLESPATTLRFSMHFPISTSSAPELSFL